MMNCGIIIAACFGYDTFFLFLPLSADEANLPSEMGSLALSLTGILLLVGYIVIGLLSDAIGHVRTLQLAMFACTAAMFKWPFCTSGWSLCLVASVYSFFAGAFSLQFSIISEVYEATSKDSLMTLFALFQVTSLPSTVLGPIIAGFLIDRVSFIVAAFFLGTTFLIGTLALLFIPKPEDQIDMIIIKYS